MSRPILFPDSCAVMQPELCGSTAAYVAAWACGDCRMDWSRRFDKRHKSAHRYSIADTRGELKLTVPVSKPQNSRVAWSEVRISTHDAWWDIHRVTLESAYGRTPYFEFYIDRFLPMLTVGVEQRFPRLEDLALAWHEQILDILGMKHSTSPTLTDTHLPPIPPGALPRYRQVRESTLGFISDLSVLDLIFNLGADAQIYLARAARSAYSEIV
ncbi:MAG: WbqC family protein [Duncaniella sp.]|nr:WbqC family protein [Duncaniella sp.]